PTHPLLIGRFPPPPYTRAMLEQAQNRPTVASLGAGAMGEALLRGLRAAGWSPDEITVAARRPERAAAVHAATGQPVLLDPTEAVAGRAVVVVATKPRDVVALLDQVDKAIHPPQTVLSVARSEEHTSELQSRENLVCRLLLEKKNTAQ